MGQLTLYKGQVIQVRVTNITACVKTFSTKEGQRCRHDITVVDKDGNSAKCEYITAVGEEPTAFVLGVLQYIEVKWVTAIGTEIIPSEPPGEKSNAPSQPKERTYTPYAGSDKTASFSFSYAKDILVAEVSKRGSVEVTDADIDRMIGWAKKINQAMTDNAPQA